MVIAIDGPAGAGKSTVAKAVAERLGFTYLDTGAMYRCVGLAANRANLPAREVVEGLEIEVGERVLLDGEDVTQAIREPGVSEAASRAAADLDVRKALVAKQQQIIKDGNWVAEGRDIGTVVAPEAAAKIFLHADPEERARRRASQIGLHPAAARGSAWARPRWSPSGAAATSATRAPAARRSSPRPTQRPWTPPA